VATRQVGEETLSPRAYDLVRSAYQVITRQGGHRLSLQDVADEAGVSKGMVLYYFKSKEHLFQVTMRWALERTAARVRRRIAGAAGGLRVEDPVAAAAAMRALIEGTFLTWLQRDDWRAAHPGCKALCHQSLRTLLGARR
jgi:AcrR family transcriptional regulator